MNQVLKESGKRKNSWLIEKDSQKQLITSLGTVCFTKKLFTNRDTGKMEYLLDRVLGMELVYVHEGIEPEAPKNKRYRLINPYYFCRVCEGKDNERFWDEIYGYQIS